MLRYPIRIGSHSFDADVMGSNGALRWAVGSNSGKRSATWRLWGNKKGDVYLSARTQGRYLKASFHKDRRCSVGFTEPFAQEARDHFGVESRHWHRWRLPDADVVRIARVIVPDSELASYEKIEGGKMAWIPAPGPGMAIVASVFVAEPPDRFHWTDPETGGNLFGILQTPTRLTWIVYTVNALDSSVVREIEALRSDARRRLADMSVPQEMAGLRIIAWAPGPTAQDMSFLDISAANLLVD